MIRIILYGDFGGVNITKICIIFIGEVWLEYIEQVQNYVKHNKFN